MGACVYNNCLFVDHIEPVYRNPQTIEQLPYMCTFDSHYGKDPMCGFLLDPFSVGKWASFAAGGTPIAGTGPPIAGNNGSY